MLDFIYMSSADLFGTGKERKIQNENIRGVFGKYVDKYNRMCIKYTRQKKFCINNYQLLNIT